MDSVQTACLFIHDDRSVVNVNEQQLLLRKNLALNYAFNDDKVKEVFGQSRSKMEAYCDSYISLHLILTRQNIKGLHYLYSSIKTYPLTIFEKRFLAIIKNILINIFHIKK